MKLSIIIPMYNAEKYIEACLDSILNSDLPKEEYEVIIVNDGSKDKGPEIAKTYCAKYDNFVYLTQENQGQSVARNYGIKEAHGEYVWCVDSDDEVNTELSFVIPCLNNNDLDSLVTRMQVIDIEGHLIPLRPPYDIEYEKIISGRDVFLSDYYIGSVCGNILKRKFLIENNLFFKPGITQQDVELSNRIFAYAEKVMLTNNITYLYKKHPSTTSTSRNIERRKKYKLNTLDVVLSLMHLSKDIKGRDAELSGLIKKKSNNILLGLLWEAYQNRGEWNENGINVALIDKIKTNGMSLKVKDYFGLKKRLLCLYLKLYFHI